MDPSKSEAPRPGAEAQSQQESVDNKPKDLSGLDMAETLAWYKSHVLGFAFDGSERVRDPFADRPRIKQIIEQLLSAERAG